MILNNLNTLKIHKLTQNQYDTALAAGQLKDNEIYLTPVGITPIEEGGTGADTPAQAAINLNVLPLTGGTLTGQSIKFYNGNGAAIAGAGTMQLTAWADPSDTTNSRTLILSDNLSLSQALRLSERTNGTDVYYNIYGDHNTHDHANDNLNPHAIEFYGNSVATDTEPINGGYIDFHFAEDRVSDYTARIEEVESGTITIHTNLEVPGNITGTNVYGAVWNDYAEFRNTLEVKPGQCVAEVGNGDLYITQERLIPGCSIVSDTFGFAIGQTDAAGTPLAVSGRVLAYTDTDRYSFKAGDSVCSGPNGTVSKMTREEIREYPDCILGFVSEIPEYETWGSGNVKVDSRIWIKLR